MYAVIKAGGKQQKVQAGDVIEVELMHHDGERVELHPILVVDDEGKTHYGKEAQRAVVVAKLVGEQKGDKVKVFKYRPKTGYARHQGHRQLQTLVEIQDVVLGGRRAASRKEAEEATKPEAESEAEAPALEAASAPAEAGESIGEEPSAGVAAEAEAGQSPPSETTRDRPHPEAEVEATGEAGETPEEVS